MVLEVGELDDPRERSCRPWRVRDPVYVDRVGFALGVRQQLDGVQFGGSEACAA
jgi:hypothetical protein